MPHTQSIFRLLPILALALLALPERGMAQINYGPSFGLVSSSIRGDKAFNSIQRYYGGGFINANVLFYRVGFQAEGLIVGAGATMEDDGSITNLKVNNTYLVLPLLVKFRLLQQFHFGLGYQYAALLGSTTTFNFGGNEREIDTSQDFRSGDAGAFIEFGYQARIGPGIHVRYYRGASRVNQQGETDLFNNYLQVGAFFALGVKPDRNEWLNRRRNRFRN